MRRKPGQLLPLELDILDAALDLRRRGEGEFHGFAIAQRIRDRHGARQLTAHGTLYKALGRLEERGLVVSRWEDPQVALDEGRPVRRLYTVTGAGERAHATGRMTATGSRTGLRPGTART
ncbi:MAG TPA: PadR family transcriptional regulator [Nitriliruptorales bacterium]|nr:PadR family transcriptional regulator [Nitriliruptorales bacterium]